MAPSLRDLRLPAAARLVGEALKGVGPRAWNRVDNPTQALALGFESLRSGLFLAESLPVFFVSGPLAGRPAPASRSARPPEDAVETSLARLRDLLERDAAMIGRGLAPLSVLRPRDPLGHGRRLLRILADGPRVTRRRRARRARDFSQQASRWLEDLPAYYRRNFHYQTDGYLSERSADLYEHQVELLFRGGADPMRRLLVAPLTAHLARRGRDGNGRGLRFLELGSGVGSATRSIARCFPEARITCLDLSHPYTNHAQRRLSEFERVDCVQGDAAALEFADGRFDAVYSVFLFHELPLPVRAQVIEESRRVLRPGGFFGLVDSLQRGDDPSLDWALEFFPREFHEPYYANYAANPMEALVEAADFEGIDVGTGYLAKWLAATKPVDPMAPLCSPD